MAGNTLGPRGYYTYTSDSGVNYNILTDTDLATAMGLTPGVSGNPQLPRRFYPRIVYAEATIGGRLVRKRLVAGTNDNTVYAAEGSTTVTVDGQTFTTTGRRGEKVTFASI